MAATPARGRRRSPPSRAHRAAPARTSLAAVAARAAFSAPARAAYLLLGTVGVAALMVAVVGPRRIEKRVLQPLAAAIEPRTEALWAESKPLRAEIAALFRRAAPQARENLARHFQSWIGHFRAG